jgi:hypothetical protein
MDESIEISKLKFDGRTDTMLVDDVCVPADDLQSVLDRALVIVRQVEDEQIAEIETCFHDCP